MKKISLKVLSLILSLAMVLSMSGIAASALVSGNYTYTLSGGKAKITAVKSSVSGTLTFPEKLNGYTVTSIGTNAVAKCDSVTKIVIPASVTTLDANAFSGCENLKTVSISKGVKSIGRAAFYNCENLTEITVDSANASFTASSGVLFNKNKTTVYCFPANKNVTTYTVPSTVKTLGAYAFADSNLKKITLPSSVTVLGTGVFADSEIESITLSSKIATISERAFYDCSELKSITFPTSVKTINAYAFYGCDKLTSVTLPSALTTLRASAFNNCENLKTATISASNSAYCSKDGIIFSKATTSLMLYPNGRTDKSYTVPSNVIAIAQNAFGYSENLEKVYIPASVTSIGNYAFTGCENLEYAKISNKSAKIGTGAFSNCDDLTIDCIKDSTAQTYAKANSIDYKNFAYKAVTGLTLNTSVLKWASGRSGSFTATVSPSDATNTALTWTSSNPSVASISSAGVIKTLKPGTTTITVTSKDNASKKATCSVIVVQGVTSVKLNAAAIKWETGKSGSFKATVSPSNAANKTLKWTSSNPDVATVSSAGKLTAVSAGTTIITCSSTDGTNKTAKCTVTVTEKMVTSVKLNAATINWPVGKSASFKATVTPTDAYNTTLLWTSSNPDVATITQTGKLTAVSKGTATITCKATDGSGKYATCKVTVK